MKDSINKEKLVSIIVPSYNYGEFLPETISSLKVQVYQNWEAILVDDGSTDNTRQVVDELTADDKRFRYFPIKNSGNATARNIGLSLAKGDYIQFLDADDLLSANKLSLQIQALSALPENAISYTRNTYFEHGNPDLEYPDFAKKGAKWMPEINAGGLEVLMVLVERNFAVISSPLFSRKFIESHKIRFPEFLENKVDWYFWLDCVLKGATLHFLDHSEAYTKIRLHNKSITADHHAQKYGEIICRGRIPQLINEAPIPLDARSKLLSLNKHLRKERLKDLVYGASPGNVDLFNQMRKNLGIGTALHWYCKNLNFLRKKLY